MSGLSLLIKPVSGSCNMRCRYCFYADITNARPCGDCGRMSEATLEFLVKRAFDENLDFCAFNFQGGEPVLAGLDFYRSFVRLQKKYNTRKIVIENSIQTNGLLIDDEWASFWVSNDFLVGLSMDCHGETHDILRPDAEGKGTFTRCLEGLNTLKKHGVKFNILCVVNRNNVLHPEEVYAFLQAHDCEYVQFIPCIDTLGENNVGYSPEPRLLGHFLCTVFDLWHAEFSRGRYRSVRFFDNCIRMLAGDMPEHCAMNGFCRGYPVIEADGGVYPCDFYASDDYIIGNVANAPYSLMLRSAVCRRFEEQSRLVHPQCAACPYRFICRGGCRREREPFFNGTPSLNHFCEAFQFFFEHALPRMSLIASDLLKSGKGC